ncbi:hypothetical protein QTG56_24270 (plasmid) [Rossellomorea sp. AcN35-11]|nr:hypothetical protein [Rossellomorea aquimaris]WJV31756.1 hypothetical protein QTG56_24270 [Rossellomorea sp. AcN35-11]
MVPKFVRELYRKYDNFDYLKDDLREGFPIDESWYQQVVVAVDELSEIEYFGLSQRDFGLLVTYFDDTFSNEEKEELSQHKYGGFMSPKEKVMETLLNYFNEIFERFAKKSVSCC